MESCVDLFMLFIKWFLHVFNFDIFGLIMFYLLRWIDSFMLPCPSSYKLHFSLHTPHSFFSPTIFRSPDTTTVSTPATWSQTCKLKSFSDPLIEALKLLVIGSLKVVVGFREV
ncbi:hypothetical protein L1987_07858 [Smallanthus sonchifolius]|uniref:Uncharacterized protein n=1 Tax=Smallanthus sonchifolius TaxID=185202 RepID=A0ACB9JIK0_9ASTR|nr:hypothetical protein L1987_07858 [Smallanthus sonchifolius]